MGSGHQHTWSTSPGQVDRWRSEEEWEEEEDAVSYRWYLCSPHGRADLALCKEGESDWPEVTEWCTTCPETREVKFVLPAAEEKVEGLEEGEREEEEEKEVEVEEDKSHMNPDESTSCDEEAVIIKTETDQSSLKCNIQVTYWRPWEVEEVEEVLEVGEMVVEELVEEGDLVLGEATHTPQRSRVEMVEVEEEPVKEEGAVQSEATPTLLSSRPVTPPPLVTPRRPGGGRVVGTPGSGGRWRKSQRRLLDFHGSLEIKYGLPPSRLQSNLRSEDPVSHRRGGVEGHCVTSPYTPGGEGLYSTSKPNKTTLLWSPKLPGGWGGGGVAAFCWGCDFWRSLDAMG